jgi:hypothetical protein
MTITLPHKHAKLVDEDKREIHAKFSFAKSKQKKLQNNHKKGECNMTKKRKE